MSTMNQILSVSKFVQIMKEKYPGAKKFAIIINFNYVNKTKFNYITNPLAVYVEKERLDNETLCNVLGVEQFTFTINGSQYSYMNSRKSYKYWSIVINCDKQTKKFDDEEYEYYPTTLYFIKDQQFIESLLPKAKEFNIDEYM